MPALNIRNLTDEVHQRLRERAQRNGRSMAAEARTILSEALLAEEQAAEAIARVWEVMDTLYVKGKPTGVADALIADRRREAKRKARLSNR